MRIDQLTLQNFRGFASLALDLHPRCTVLAGVNGSGKSSILDALAFLMDELRWSVLGVEASRFEVRDVRLEVRQWQAARSLEPQLPLQVDCRGHAFGGGLWWYRRMLRFNSRGVAEGDNLYAIAATAAERLREGGEVDLPLIAYFGTQRLHDRRNGTADNRTRLMSRTAVYETWRSPSTNHRLFLAWLAHEELLGLRRVAHALQATGGTRVEGPLRTDAMEAVSQVAAVMIEAQSLAFDLDGDQLLVHFEDRTLPFEMLSDGQRNLVALAADLAWRAIQLNPQFGAQAPERTEGVVLIDEVELHLHPAWQREILGRLTSAFPKLQFVVTTHSPQVLASVAADQVRLLDRDGRVHPVGAALGLDSNTVLRELMGVPERPEATLRALARLASLIERGAQPEARVLFDELSGQLGPSDPELRVLAWELRDLEVSPEEPRDATD